MKHVKLFEQFLFEKYVWETSGDKDDKEFLTSSVEIAKNTYAAIAPATYNIDDFEEALDSLLSKYTKDPEKWFDAIDSKNYAKSNKIHGDWMNAVKKEFKTTKTNSAWKGHLNDFTRKMSNIYQITLEAKAGRTENRGYKVNKRQR